MTDTLTCVHDWCIADHDVSTLHRQAEATATDLYGTERTIGLFHVADTGRTGVYVGSHEFSLIEAQRLVHAVQTAIALGIDLPGALK